MQRVSLDLGRLLIAAGAVSKAEVEAALFVAVLRGISFPRALIDRAAISERALEAELERRGGLALRQVVGARDLVARLPRAMCRRLGAVPIRLDPGAGTVDVAAADPLDRHIADEFSFHLGAPVRIYRAPITAIEEAIRALELDEREQVPARSRRATPAFPHGAPQSTIPPPPSYEVPIPLIRRAAVPSFDEPGLHEPPSGKSGRRVPAHNGHVLLAEAPSSQEEPILPLRHAKAAPGARGSPASARGPLEAARGAGARRATLRAPADVEPPAVSFPPSPPVEISPPFKLLASIMPQGSPAPDRGPDSGGREPAPSTRRLGRLPLDAPSGVAPASRRSAGAPSGVAPASRRSAVDAEVPPLLRGGGRPEGAASPSSLRSGRLPALPPAPEELIDPLDDDPPPQPFVDLSDVIDALYLARTRDDVVRLALRGLRLFARRVAIFAAHRGVFRGFACNAEFGDQEALRKLTLPMDQPSILATAVATHLYVGPIPGTPTHAPLLDVMVNPSLDVAAVAVQVVGRPAMILVADRIIDTASGSRRMVELARAVGEAFSRILSARG
ncbi:hypothetical protein SOCE836_049480 [Sorangium cellulosum]|uniref:Type II secretion system protein GspE N-terminal domain-containing protein n=1 Tax=Sorangium cellulosum TaxID=56 RepID=A0A4P2QS57_SORCE|nr:hypothetical protein SOCE836_049480 [Sorangium cellulosum]WCQ92178.1 hypothetical protein NQZ70_04914 [Sorangium sp. Soce836]